jgi:hypothetical protein
MALWAIEPLLTAGCTNGNLRVQDMLAGHETEADRNTSERRVSNIVHRQYLYAPHNAKRGGQVCCYLVRALRLLSAPNFARWQVAARLTWTGPH